MRKLVLIPLAIGGILAVSGGILIGCSWGQVKTTTNTHDLTGKSFSKIKLNLATTDVEFIISEESKVVCTDTKTTTHEVKVEDDTLIVNSSDNKKWYQVFDPNKKVKVYVPVTSFTSLNAKLSTGDVHIPSGFTFGEASFELSTGKVEFKANVDGHLNIVQTTGDLRLENVTANSMYLQSSTGKKELSNLTVAADVQLKSSTGQVKINKLSCNNLTINASTGDIDASEAVMSGDLNVHVSTGDVTFKNSDAQKINIETSTGDVELSLLSSHDIEAETDTGKTDYPKHAAGPSCDIKTDTGDIKVSFIA